MMNGTNVRQAIEQVSRMQTHVLANQRFRGYSGRTRALSGILALAASFLLGSTFVPQTPLAHLIGWSSLFAVAFTLNYVALIYWFFNDPQVKRDIRRLRPVLDVVPPLLVGAVLTLALILQGHFHLLFGVWMCLFGLANLASRRVLPKLITLVGCMYLCFGAVCLLTSGLSFLNPWPMGIAFFIGESTSGMILHYDQARKI